MKFKTILISTAILSLFFVCAANASDWAMIYSDEDYTIYANKASIVQAGDCFEVAERWEYKTDTVREALAKESGQPPKFDITVKRYKKKQPVYQIISITYYNDKGEAYYSPARDDAWRILSPGMLGELLWSAITKLL